MEARTMTRSPAGVALTAWPAAKVQTFCVGGAGKDTFVFDTKPTKKTNLDTIADFSVKDDNIQLDHTVFTRLELKTGTLKKGHFTVGSKAKDKNDYVVYDDKKGVLYYDQDGSGRKKAVAIAELDPSLELTHKDFFVI
jgi:Ca2+-binding RTX toxin-like protein